MQSIKRGLKFLSHGFYKTPLFNRVIKTAYPLKQINSQSDILSFVVLCSSQFCLREDLHH